MDRAPPEKIWTKHCNGAGVDQATFQKYFNGASDAIAILLAAARRIVPITMDQLSQIRACFHPPQVVARLTAAEAETLRRLAGEQSR